MSKDYNGRRFIAPTMSLGKGLTTSRIALSTAAKVAAEKLLRPKATSLADVPYDLGAVTKAWMQAVICQDVPDARIESLQRGGGSSGTSERAQYSLSYNQAGQAAGLPTSVFAKATPGVLTRMANGLTGTMASEGSFYRYIQPELTDVEAPVGYHSAWDVSSYRSIHVLEDLVATKRATFCDPTTVISRAQADEAVIMMASYHGKYYDSPRLNSEFSWLRSYPDWWYHSMKYFGIKGTAMKGVNKAEAIIPSSIFQQRHKIWQGFVESVDAHNQLSATLLHGDVHLGNWYITGAGKMGLCDWQCVSKGHWSRDLAYALSAILPIAHRREWERELIRLYLDTLQEKGGPSVSFDEAIQYYRQQLFAALLMWAPTYHHSIFLPDMQPESVSEEMIKRITTAMDDYDCMSLVAKS